MCGFPLHPAMILSSCDPDIYNQSLEPFWDSIAVRVPFDRVAKICEFHGQIEKYRSDKGCFKWLIFGTRRRVKRKCILGADSRCHQRFIVRSRKVSEARDQWLVLSSCFEICQASGQHCYRGACQISRRYEHFNTRSRAFELLWDLKQSDV